MASRNLWESARDAAVIREAELKLGVSFVGSPLDHPIQEAEYRRVFAALAQEGADGLIVSDEPENVTNRRLIVDLAEKGRLPTVYPFQLFVEAGRLIAYGSDLRDLGHRVADMVDQVLRGEKPADLAGPAADQIRASDQSQDRKRARSDDTPALLARADEVIE
jgi:putative tryptophan/tyrosine transport system substrate-binding protein